jgi:elongation factor Ts
VNLSEAKQVQFNKMDYQLLKELRQETQVSFSLCKKALEESGNVKKRALELLKEWGIKKAAGKSDRATNAGGVYSYIHHNNLIGAIVELQTETDFVSGNADFKKLGAEIAMQAASIRAKNVEELLKQNSIREPSKTIDDMIKEAILKFGENIVISRFQRFEVGIE